MKGAMVFYQTNKARGSEPRGEGVLPKMAYLGRFRPKEAPYSPE